MDTNSKRKYSKVSSSVEINKHCDHDKKYHFERKISNNKFSMHRLQYGIKNCDCKIFKWI